MYKELDLSSFENGAIIQNSVRQVLNDNVRKSYEYGDYFLFRCHICGDSSRSKSKKRGYIIKHSDVWQYYCHNCGYSVNVITWMKNFFPDYFRNMFFEMAKNEEEVSLRSFNNIRQTKEKHVDEKSIIKHFKKLTKFPEHIEYCKNRKIPESVYSNWYFDATGEYMNRIIIPFRDDKGKIYYWQGRAVLDYMFPKYKSREIIRTNTIYNYYNVDKNLPVIIMEGPIDSLFVQNSIALTGVKKYKNEYLNIFDDKCYMFDNDADGRKMSKELLELGNNVFNWRKFLEDYECSPDIKDVNEFIMKNDKGVENLDLELIMPYMTNNVFHNFYFL